MHIPAAPFGRTGHHSTRAIFGAAALGDVTEEDADRAFEVLTQYGINHIDVAASYGDAELHVGRWMKQHRDRFFLATKSGERTKSKAREELHRSLERLQTDHIDLWQLHNLVDPLEWETALGAGGAIEAAIEARDEGTIRSIGVTGHGIPVARQHQLSLERFAFDSVLLPYSHVLMQDDQYCAEFERLIGVCESRGVAVQTIKGIVRRPWADRAQTRATWYEPLTEQTEIDRAVHWVLGRPGVFLNTAGDVTLLPRVLDAAARFEHRPSDREMTTMQAEHKMSPLFVQ